MRERADFRHAKSGCREPMARETEGRGRLFRRVGAVALCLWCCLIPFRSHGGEAGPDAVLASYLEASFKADYVTAYRYLSSLDKKVKSLEDYLEERKGDYRLFMKVVGNMVSYRVRNVTVFDHSAKAEVEMKTPDFVEMLSDLMTSSMVTLFLGGDVESEIGDWLLERAQGKNVPTKTTVREVTLLQETDGWRVYLGWKEAEKGSGKENLLEDLLKGAKKLKEHRM